MRLIISFNIASEELRLPKTVPPKMEVEGGQQTAPQRPPETVPPKMEVEGGQQAAPQRPPETRPGDEPRL